MPEAKSTEPAHGSRRGHFARSEQLGVIFALFTAVTAFGIGNMVQANSISVLLKESLSVPQWASGMFMMILTELVILGGIRAIARVCGILVPFMAVAYVGGCFVLLALGWSTIPATIALIVKSAITGQAAVGGFLGASVLTAMRYGVARGLFSNESDLGSAPILAAAAQTKNAVRQALVSSTGTFWDTVVVCLMTGVVLVNSGVWMSGTTDGAVLTKAAFARFPVIGPAILVVGLLTFVFSTILGWSYYGEKAVEYVFGKRAVRPYRWLWTTSVLVGSVLTLPLVWSLAGICTSPRLHDA